MAGQVALRKPLLWTEQWRQILRQNPKQARIVLQQLVGPLHVWHSEQKWTGVPKPEGLLVGMVHGLASPTGVVPEWTREIPGEVKAA